MSDHKPIGGENSQWVPPPPDKEKPVDPNTRLCIYCWRYHGGVNAKIQCLENGVRTLRAQIEAKRR